MMILSMTSLAIAPPMVTNFDPGVIFKKPTFEIIKSFISEIVTFELHFKRPSFSSAQVPFKIFQRNNIFIKRNISITTTHASY